MSKRKQIRQLQRDVAILKLHVQSLQQSAGMLPPPPVPAGPPGMPADYQQLREPSPLPAVDIDALRNITNYGARYG